MGMKPGVPTTTPVSLEKCGTLPPPSNARSPSPEDESGGWPLRGAWSLVRQPCCGVWSSQSPKNCGHRRCKQRLVPAHGNGPLPSSHLLKGAPAQAAIRSRKPPEDPPPHTPSIVAKRAMHQMPASTATHCSVRGQRSVPNVTRMIRTVSATWQPRPVIA